MIDTRLKPDLVISGDTEIDDLIELLEKNDTELYSLGTLISFFVDAGFDLVVPIVLEGVYNNEFSEELEEVE